MKHLQRPTRSLRRMRFDRDWLRQLPRIVLISTVLLCLVLGYWGFVLYSHTPGFRDDWQYGPADLMYYTLQLFVGASGPVGGLADMAHVPWQLNVARLLAPAAAVIGAIIAMFAIFDEQIRRAVGRSQRGHVVVVGDTPVAAVIADALTMEDAKVERVHTGTRDELINAGVRGAAAVYICNDDTGDPGANLRVATTVDSIPSNYPGRSVAVALFDPGLAPAMIARHITQPNPVVDLFTLDNVAASRLASYATRDANVHRIWLLGSGQMRDELVFELVQEWSVRHQAADHLELVVSGSDAQGAIDRAATRMTKPLLDQVTMTAVGNLTSVPHPDVTVICGKDDAESLELALETPQAWQGGPGSLIVHVARGDQAAALFGAEGVGIGNAGDETLEVVTTSSLIEQAQGGLLVHESLPGRLAHVAARTSTRLGTEAGQSSVPDQISALLTSLDKAGWKVVPFGASIGLHLPPEAATQLAQNYLAQHPNGNVGSLAQLQATIASLPETLAQMGLGIAEVSGEIAPLISSATPRLVPAEASASDSTGHVISSATPRITSHATPKLPVDGAPHVVSHATPAAPHATSSATPHAVSHGAPSSATHAAGGQSTHATQALAGAVHEGQLVSRATPRVEFGA